MKIIRTDKNITASALFGVAAIQIFMAGMDWFLHGAQVKGFGGMDWLITVSGFIYIALGIAARWIRLTAAIVGSGFYAVFFLGISDLLMAFQIPVVLLLLVAVVSALKHQAAKN